MNRPAQHAKSRPAPALLNGKLYETSSVKGGLLLAAGPPRPSPEKEPLPASLSRWRTCRGRAEAAARFRIVVIVEGLFAGFLGFVGLAAMPPAALPSPPVARGRRRASPLPSPLVAKRPPPLPSPLVAKVAAAAAAAAAALATGGRARRRRLQPTAAAAVAAE